MKIKIGPYRKNRAFHIHIDDYDVWNLDHTLASIIHPALIRLKDTKQGYPQLFEDGMVTPHYWDRQLHFDFIDEKLNGDINVTSPTGLKTFFDLSNINLADYFWKGLRA